MTISMSPDGILAPNTTIRGTYIVEHMIGEGGMGVVYACRHKTLEKQYALKVLEPKYARMTSLRSRFLSEGKIQAKLSHPHIVKVIDVIDNEKDGGTSSFLAIVMEFVKGNSLDHIIERGPLSEYDAVSIALVVLDALGYAHHNGIVHRDMKPSNVMISDELARDALYNGVKVMDFGIAKLLDSESQSYTMTGSTIGTPLYMPPEQIETPKLIDERADLYAIGTMLYELLCGRTPFAEFKEFNLFKAQLEMKPPSIKNYRKDISDKLEAIIMKSLEKNRDDRYPNAEAFQRALLSLGGYDDIHLFLNPNDGIVVSTSNPLLQKKIQNAVNRSAKDSEKSPQKAQHEKELANDIKQMFEKQMVEQSSDIQPTVDVNAFAQNEPQKLNAANAASNKSVEPEKAANAEKKPRRKSRDEMAYAMTADPSESMPKVAKLAPPANDSEAPQRVKEKSETADRVRAARKNEARKAAAEATDKVSDAKPRTKTSADSPKRTDAKDKSTRRPRPNQGETGKRHESQAHVVPQPSATATVNSLETISNERHPLRLALILAFLILLILCAASLVYRQDTNMAPAITPAETTTDHVEAAPQVELDIAHTAIAEIQTPFGRMTRVPQTKHKVSTSEQPVELPPFDIDQTEVSHYQYQRCIDAGKCAPLGYEPKSMTHPVTDIGFAAAQAYCEYAGKKLPTLEQWEAAARFGNADDESPNLSCPLVLYGANSACKKQNPNHPESVFSRPGNANAGHLRNMLGNVREWVNTPDANQKQMMTKGGSYLTKAADMTISANQPQPTNQGAPDLGFRCVK